MNFICVRILLIIFSEIQDPRRFIICLHVNAAENNTKPIKISNIQLEEYLRLKCKCNFLKRILIDSISILLQLFIDNNEYTLQYCNELLAHLFIDPIEIKTVHRSVDDVD